jgi:hypothetical protein
MNMRCLAEPDVLKQRLMILAALDLILCEEEWLRYHRYDLQWAPNVSLATIDNGAGDDLFILFAPEGVIIKGFDHESGLSPHAQEDYEVFPGIYDETPKSLLALLEDEAFEKEDVTFCIWRKSSDTNWRMGDVNIPEGEDDGSDFLLGTIFESAELYVDWAKYYYDMPISIEVVKQIYDGSSITKAIVQTLNPGRNVQDAMRELNFM